MALDIATLLETSRDGLRRGKNRMDAGGKTRNRRSNKQLKSACQKQVVPQNRFARPREIQIATTPANLTHHHRGSLFTKTTRFIGKLTGFISTQPRAAGNHYTPFPNCEPKVIRKHPAQHKTKSRPGTRQAQSGCAQAVTGLAED